MKLKFKIILFIILLLPVICLLTSLMVPVEILADSSNTTIIMVNISEVSALTVTPGNIAWLQVSPGTNSSLTRIAVKNTGSSTFAAGIFLSVNSAANSTFNPTAGDSPSKYMAGSFLVATNDTFSVSDQYYFVNQIAWNESTYPEPVSPTAGAHSWGFYNNKSDSFLWELKGNGSGLCTGGAAIKIKQTVDSGTGSRDLSSGTSAGVYVANTTEWSTWTFSDGPLVDYCVAAYYDCKRIMIYKFDMNSSLPSCNSKAYYIAPGSLVPGVTKYFNLKVHIPKGVPSGTVANSTVTFTGDTA